jgi:hypothetical protein
MHTPIASEGGHTSTSAEGALDDTWAVELAITSGGRRLGDDNGPVTVTLLCHARSLEGNGG